MLKGGPIVHFAFRTECLSEEEMRVWVPFKEKMKVPPITMALFRGGMYGLNQVNGYVKFTIDSEMTLHEKGFYMDSNNLICFDKEEVNFYV